MEWEWKHIFVGMGGDLMEVLWGYVEMEVKLDGDR